MSVQSVLHRTFAILPISLLLACGGSPSSDEADSGAPSTKDGAAPHDGGGSGHDAGGGEEADTGGGETPDAGDDDSGSSDLDASPDAGPPVTPTTKAVMYIDNW